MQCPKCNAEISRSDVDCPSCGVVIAKYRSIDQRMQTQSMRAYDGVVRRKKKKKSVFSIEVLIVMILAGVAYYFYTANSDFFGKMIKEFKAGITGTSESTSYEGRKNRDGTSEIDKLSGWVPGGKEKKKLAEKSTR